MKSFIIKKVNKLTKTEKFKIVKINDKERSYL